MPPVARFFRWFSLRDQDPTVVQAQYRELRRQIPLLYVLLSTNALSLSYTQFDNAPFWLAVLAPWVVVTCSAVRLMAWMQSSSPDMPVEQIVRKLRTTTIIAALIALVCVAWALEMRQYGALEEQAHVAILIAATVIGCVFCLIHLPQAALCVIVIVVGSYFVYFLQQENSAGNATTLSLLLVTLVVVRMLLSSFTTFSGLVQSRSETDRLHGQMTTLAHTDTLTALPNRLAFFGSLKQMLESLRTDGSHLTLGMIDLDRFKAANDTFGHLVGDRLLEAVGQRLREQFAGRGLVARLGGDEFAVAMPVDASTAIAFMDQLCIHLSEPYRIGDFVILIGATCGVATMEDCHEVGSSLYEQADYALYYGKLHRRGLATLYSPSMQSEQLSERAIEAALRSCDVHAEMDLYLQPIFDVVTGRISSVEALARWTHPMLGPVRPDIFIPLAERCGIIHHLTTCLFDRALAYTSRIPSDVLLSFNLSGHDIVSRETILVLVAAIRSSGLDPSRIVFELTETAVVRDFAIARESLGLLHGLGARIALDDFGTGQSNFVHLHELPIDKVKIDQSFVSGPKADDRPHLLAAMVAFCHSLQLRCIAEGVETVDQLDRLRQIGCDAFQGYYGARPMPIDELLSFLQPMHDCQTASKTGSASSSVQFDDGNGGFRRGSLPCRAAFRSQPSFQPDSLSIIKSSWTAS